MEAIVKTIKSELPAIESRMRQFGLDIERIKSETSFALQIINEPKNSFLRKCDKNSIVKSIINIAQVGLTLNPVAREAYLIPRYSKYLKGYECHLEPSYVGIVKLITDAGSVTSIQTNLVYEKDEFSLVHSLAGADFRHVPYVNPDRGKITGVYSVAVISTGERQFEYMTAEEVFQIRNISESWKAFQEEKTTTCIWKTWEGEMFRKTCLKRMQKYLPRTDRMQYLDTAIDLTNHDWEPSMKQIAYAQSLLSTCNLTEESRDQIERELPTCNSSQ